MKKWDEIRSDYKKAAEALCLYDRDSDPADMDVETGLRYLWKAYHEASEADEIKDHLVYGRILLWLSRFGEHPINDALYTKLVTMSHSEFEKAMVEGQKPGEAERALAQIGSEIASEIMRCEAAPTEEHIKMIDRYELLEGLDLYYSDTVSFQYADNTVRIKLRKHDAVITLRFDGATQVYADDMAYHFGEKLYCYRMEGTNHLIFKSERYEIHCSKVTVESVETAEDTEPVEDNESVIQEVPFFGFVSA